MVRKEISVTVLVGVLGVGGAAMLTSGLSYWIGLAAVAASSIGLAVLWWRSYQVPFEVTGLQLQPHNAKPRHFIVGTITKKSRGATAPVRIELVGLAKQTKKGTWDEFIFKGYPVSLSRIGDDGYTPAPLRDDETKFAFLVNDSGSDSLRVQWQKNYSSFAESLATLKPGRYRAKINVSDNQDSIQTRIEFKWSGDIASFASAILGHRTL